MKNTKVSHVQVPIILVKKSNRLIQSIGKTTLLSNKIFLTALLHLEERHGVTGEMQEYYDDLKMKTGIDFTEGLIAEFHNTDLTRILGKQGGGFYQRLKELMNPRSPKSLRNQWAIIIKNKESGLYGSAELITATLYDSKAGKLYIKFNSEDIVKREVYNMSKNYSSLDYILMMQMDSIYSYRVYELMMSRIGYQDSVTNSKQDIYSFTYGLSELKYLLCLLDPYINNDVYSALTTVQNPNFDVVENVISGENVMPNYAEVKRNVLDKAKKEIDEKTDYIFDFNPIRSGKGGKVIEVELKMTRKNSIVNVITEDTVEDTMKEDILDEISELIDEPLKLKDIRAIAEAAQYDLEKVKKAYGLMKKNRTPIGSPTGWLISAIKDEYQEPVPKKPAIDQNVFNSFQQNRYDFEQLEFDIIDN